MQEFYQAVHLRGQQSVGGWGTFAATFQVGALKLDEHTADLTLILTQVMHRDVQTNALDDAMLTRIQNFDFIHDIAVRVPQLIIATLENNDPLNNDLDDVFGVDPDSQHGCMERARRIVSLWNRVNTKRAEMTPPLPALTIGSTAVAAFQTALNNNPGLMQIVENERSELNQKKSQLQITARRVDRNNKRWYEAWGNNFAVGSPEHNALSEVDTEEGTTHRQRNRGTHAVRLRGRRRLRRWRRQSRNQHDPAMAGGRRGPGLRLRHSDDPRRTDPPVFLRRSDDPLSRMSHELVGNY